jgi:hypothetical protein
VVGAVEDGGSRDAGHGPELALAAGLDEAAEEDRLEDADDEPRGGVRRADVLSPALRWAAEGSTTE